MSECPDNLYELTFNICATISLNLLECSSLLGKLHDVSVTAVKRTFRSCPVLGFIFGSNCVNDKACSQVETLCHFCLTGPTSWKNIRTHITPAKVIQMRYQRNGIRSVPKLCSKHKQHLKIRIV